LPWWYVFFPSLFETVLTDPSQEFRPANILARISGLDGLPEDGVLNALGQPGTAKVITASGGSHYEPTAPQYLVYPISWDSVELSALGTNFIIDKACIIDFGESYEMSDPSPDLGIPQIYCSPEYTLDKKVGIGSDVWALGCTLFEIRTGRRLFDTFDDDIDEYLCKLAMILGKFPEPWWSTTWERRKDFFEDYADADGRVLEIRREVKSGNSENHYPAREKEPEIFIIQQQEPRSLQDALAPGMFHENRHGPGGTRRNIAQQEIDCFSELLARIFKYAPEERLTARDVLAHAWFNL
jgi:serine/threonine protein kinase